MHSTTTEPTTLNPGDRLLLWQLARHGMPPEEHLEVMQTTRAELKSFVVEHPEEYAALKRQALSLRLLDRQALGEFVLAQFLNHLVMAKGAREAAAILKVSKQLPHWVLPQSTGEELAALAGGEFNGELAGQLSQLRQHFETPRQSRQQRRAEASAERKAARNGRS